MNERAPFEERRKHLQALTDDQLKTRFWDLAEQIVTPLAELARTHTTPSIERSVLLRMGFSSLESKAIVERVSAAKLLGKGAGHVVLRLAHKQGVPYREAGRAIISGAGLEGLF